MTATDMSTEKTRPTPENRVLVERIRSRMAELGTNPAQVNRKAKLGNSAVHDVLSGKNKKPGISLIRAIAKALDTTVAYLVGEREGPAGGAPLQSIAEIPIVGFAETGAFRRMIDFDDIQHDLPTVAAQKSSLYPQAKHFALKVRGDSMNAAKPTPILEGMMVLCVDMVDAGLEIESGRIYAVRQTLDGGQTWECTIKRAHVFRDRFELRPESTNKRHQPLLIPRGKGADSDERRTIEAIGLVYSIQISLEG